MDLYIDGENILEFAKRIDEITKTSKERENKVMPCPMCGSTEYEDDSEYGCETPEMAEYEDEPEHIEIRKQKLKNQQISLEHVNKKERESQRHRNIMEEIKALKDAGITIFNRQNTGKSAKSKKGK